MGDDGGAVVVEFKSQTLCPVVWCITWGEGVTLGPAGCATTVPVDPIIIISEEMPVFEASPAVIEFGWKGTHLAEHDKPQTFVIQFTGSAIVHEARFHHLYMYASGRVIACTCVRERRW